MLSPEITQDVERELARLTHNFGPRLEACKDDSERLALVTRQYFDAVMTLLHILENEGATEHARQAALEFSMKISIVRTLYDM